MYRKTRMKRRNWFFSKKTNNKTNEISRQKKIKYKTRQREGIQRSKNNDKNDQQTPLEEDIKLYHKIQLDPLGCKRKNKTLRGSAHVGVMNGNHALTRPPDFAAGTVARKSYTPANVGVAMGEGQ